MANAAILATPVDPAPDPRALVLSVLEAESDNNNLSAIEMTALCDRVQRLRAESGAGPVAMTVPRGYVALCTDRLKSSAVRISTVINNMDGSKPASEVVDQARHAIGLGARELELVFPIRSWHSGNRTEAGEIVRAARAVCHNRRNERVCLKVAIDASQFDDIKSFAGAVNLSIAAGADFLKTGMATASGSAAERDNPLATVLDCCHQHLWQTGQTVGVAIASGVDTLDAAQDCLSSAGVVMGPRWVTPHTFRLADPALFNAVADEMVTSR